MVDEDNHSTESGRASHTPGGPSLVRRLIILGAVLVAFGALASLFGDQLSLRSLAAREAQFREFQQAHPVLVYLVAFSAYVLVAGLSLPGATAMTLLVGWLFGFWRSVLLVSFASTTGATMAFLISRYLLRDAFQDRFGDRLRRFNDALDREGAYYLFTLRLIPAVPFFVINIVMGLTPLRLATYWWVSQLGMLPGTAVYVYAGSNVPDLQTLAQTGASGILSRELLVSFVLLGLFPIVTKKLMAKVHPPSGPRASATVET